MRIAICDDETNILDEVSCHIEKYSEENGKAQLEVTPYNSASSLLNSIDDGALFDILVLDVYIGDEMGTALAKNIRRRGIDSPIIFLTTSIEHAPQGYETGTLRYLIKPLEPEKFYEAMDAALLVSCTGYLSHSFERLCFSLLCSIFFAMYALCAVLLQGI